MGLLQTYQTGQTFAPSGGNGSNGVALGPFANWAALPVSGVDGALASVTSLGPGNAYGIAVYDGGASEWALYMAWFDTVADMTAFSDPISTGALASVEASASNDENGVRYQYDGAAWARTAALTAGYAWALTLTQAVTGADPSGVGAVQAGDYGVYTPAGGTPIVYRYAPAVTVAAGAGGVPQAQWLPPEVYAGTVTIEAYLVGTENVTDAVALNAQGWPTVVRTNGTITSQTTRVRLATTAANGRASISALTSGVTASTRVYVRWLYRVATGNQTLDNATTATLRFFDGANALFLAMPLSADVAKGVFFWTGSGTVSSGTQQASQSALPNLSGTDVLMEAYLDTSTNISTVLRDGVEVTASTRISNATADSLIFWAASGPTASQTASMDLSRVVVATW